MPIVASDTSRTVARIKGDTQLIRYLADLDGEVVHMQDLGVDRASGLAQWVVVSLLVEAEPLEPEAALPVLEPRPKPGPARTRRR